MKFSQDFQVSPIEDINRGIYYPSSRRSIVFVGLHESITEILDTCEHETIHGILTDIIDDDELLVDDQHEHWVIRHVKWANEHL